MNFLYKAARSHYEARRDEAIATLEVYFNKSVGIGEHSELLEEIRKWTEVLGNAEDCMESLERNFSNDGSVKAAS